MPMSETFFATASACVADKFGVSWMVMNAKNPYALSTLALRSGTPNSRRQTSASTSTPLLDRLGVGIGEAEAQPDPGVLLVGRPFRPGIERHAGGQRRLGELHRVDDRRAA